MTMNAAGGDVYRELDDRSGVALDHPKWPWSARHAGPVAVKGADCQVCGRMIGRGRFCRRCHVEGRVPAGARPAAKPKRKIVCSECGRVRYLKRLCYRCYRRRYAVGPAPEKHHQRPDIEARIAFYQARADRGVPLFDGGGFPEAADAAVPAERPRPAPPRSGQMRAAYDRTAEVAALARQGFSYAAIARRLRVAESTVGKDVGRARRWGLLAEAGVA